MVALILPKSVQNVLVVGPVHNKLDKLDLLEKLLPDYDWVVINGILAINSHLHTINSQTIERLTRLIQTNKVVVNISGADLVFASKLDALNPMERWIHDKPNIVLINFGGSFQCLVVGGGIPSHIVSLDQLTNNIEISFAPHPHKTYSGGLGYVVSNMPITKWAPKFYSHSAQIGNVIEGQVYAFKMTRNGIQHTILL